ncbi:hypothetical protein B0H14DRAFT_2654645 [Mycena olivaceomarginata]|nr:hypothetical protein B0H14DRAFT_2654645 [Mycena olivaceomarginata]
MVLKWWRDAMSVASPDWEQGIAEVTWVLEQLHKDSDSDVEASPTISPTTAAPSEPVLPGNEIADQRSSPLPQELGEPNAKARPAPRPLYKSATSQSTVQGAGSGRLSKCSPRMKQGLQGLHGKRGCRGLARRDRMRL